MSSRELANILLMAFDGYALNFHLRGGAVCPTKQLTLFADILLGGPQAAARGHTARAAPGRSADRMAPNGRRENSGMTGRFRPRTLPRVFPTVVHMLAECCAISRRDRAGLRPAQSHLRRVFSLRRRFCRGIGRHGARGSRVALVCANSLDMPIAMFGMHAAGAQAVPINPTYTERELGYILEDADPIAIVYDAEVASKIEPLVAALGYRHTVRIGGEAAAVSISGGTKPIGKLPQPWPTPDDLATLQYTGGTTGRPKGVNISHRQMAVNISQREAALPTRPGDESILCMMPLFHVFAVAMCLHLSAYCGGRLVIMPRYRPEAVLDLIAAQKITPLAGRPDGLHRPAQPRKIRSDRFFLVAHRLFRLGSASGGDSAAMVGANRDARSWKVLGKPRPARS